MSERPLPGGLVVASVLASGAALVAVVTWLLADRTADGGSLADVTGILLAIGLLCLAGLTVRRSPALAWFAVTFTAIFATREPATLQAALRERAIDESWLAAAAIASVTAVVAMIVASLYATRPDRLFHPALVPLAWVLTAWLAAASALTIALTVAGFDEDSRLPLSFIVFLPVRGWGILVVGAALVGVIEDVLPAARRAQARQTGADARSGPAVWLVVFIDELVGRADARRAAAELERHRLAGELHAEAMPALRAALFDLEAGRPAEEVAARLRAIAADLEGVVTERRDPILESLGLVPALEALAERTEARSGTIVELTIPDGDLDGRPPGPVEAAAYRTAVLAVDNAMRHASPSRIGIHVVADARAVELEVDDDGPGIADDAERRALAAGRQGLAEIRRLGAETGARVAVARAPGGGTVVRFHWVHRR